MSLKAHQISQRIDERAREIWNEREMKMPAHARQKWEYGTALARHETRKQAAREIGVDWRDF